MALVRSSEFLALQFFTDTAVTIDPAGAAAVVTIPALQSFMSTLDLNFSGAAMFMYHPEQKLSGFVCNEIRTIA